MYVRLHEKRAIERFLEQDPFLHIYALGDLDDFFWPYTTWYGSQSNRELEAIVLVYAGPQLPTVLALSDEHDAMAKLLTSIEQVLPYRFYAHLSPGLETILRTTHEVESGADHYKMALHDGGPVAAVDTSGVERLGPGDLPALQMLYDESYPGNWFDPRMLETNHHFGIRDGGQLISAAGVHVFSPRYRVAALGNIVTRPECRNNGHATRVTAALCRSLSRAEIRIGLNVQADNVAAISCYRKLGFQVSASYGEFEVHRVGTA